MPQIYIIPSNKLIGKIGAIELRLAPNLILAVEKAFGIEGKNDTAVTCASRPEFVVGEADLQIEVRYTAGEDEYGWGRPFDPTRAEQEKAAELIRMAVYNWLCD